MLKTIEPLTDREKQVALMVADGKLNKQIAYHLGIGPQTVKNHVYSIFEKTGCASRIELALRILKEKYAIN